MPNPENAKKKNSLRIAVYCRNLIDTPEEYPDEQEKMCVEIVVKNRGWMLSGIYADICSPAIKYRRAQFQRLMRDCRKGLIDCVLCESAAILIRIDKKEIEYIRQLRDQGINFVFEQDGFDSKSECFDELLTIIEAFAEEKFRSKSESYRRKKRKRMQAGDIFYHKLFGYRKSGGNYELDPAEAEVVRIIFDNYEHGTSTDDIAKTLTDSGTLTPAGRNNHWHTSIIRNMIKNEKYVGDYRAQKYYNDAHGNEHRNDGALPSVYHRDHHPAIIGREQFERCQVILKLRTTSEQLQYPFGDYLRCPYCGHVLYKRRVPKEQCFCCEGDGACRRFVIDADSVERAILEAYETIKTKAVEKKAGLRDYAIAIEAVKLLRIKAEHQAFERIDYWWLDELVEQISFGQHTCTDDWTISVHWRCGLISTLPSGVEDDVHDPRRKAEQWDAFILSRPDRYPQLVDEIQKQK